jgi:glycosyltransferase involved in cell wall biosynthesis
MRHLVALLGRGDEPVDGVADYCSFLGEALERRGVEVKFVRVPWARDGWWRALRQLRRESSAWRGKWVLLQYTALGWSRRGFPLGAVAALLIARRQGARCGVVFHDVYGGHGPRWIDRVRFAFQQWVVRKLYDGAEKVIVTAPVETIRWLPGGGQKATFVPIGANIHVELRGEIDQVDHKGAWKTVVVFCLSNPPNLAREVSDISHAMRRAATNGAKPRIVFLGRGTAEAQREIEQAFEQVPVEVSNLGVQGAAEVARTLAGADAMLCVRGELFPGRGSAIAGIACGLPVVGYGDAVRSFPLSEAGVCLVPYGNREALGAALAQVLEDAELSERLRATSYQAREKYFSWNAIAEKIDQALNEVQAKE